MKTITGTEAGKLLKDAEIDDDVSFRSSDADIRRTNDGYVVCQRVLTEPLAALLSASADLARSLRSVERERDAYKRAKAENDDRFMGERDEARHELEALRKEHYRIRNACNDMESELGNTEQALKRAEKERTQSLHDQARWHHNSMFLARAVAADRPEAKEIAAFMLDEKAEGPAFDPENHVAVGWTAQWCFDSFANFMRKPDGGFRNHVTMRVTSPFSAEHGRSPIFSLTIQREEGKTPGEIIGELREELAEATRYRSWQRALDDANAGTSACFDPEVLQATAARNVALHAYGKLLRELRADKKTMHEAAKVAGCTVPVLSGVERGREPPFSEEITLRLCALIGCESDGLLEAARKAEELLDA